MLLHRFLSYPASSCLDVSTRSPGLRLGRVLVAMKQNLPYTRIRQQTTAAHHGLPFQHFALSLVLVVIVDSSLLCMFFFCFLSFPILYHAPSYICLSPLSNSHIHIHSHWHSSSLLTAVCAFASSLLPVLQLRCKQFAYTLDTL